MTAKPPDEVYSEKEITRRYEATLKRVLSTPPQHKTTKGDKSRVPKKRGRPPKPKE